MIKKLMKSLREYKTDTILTPLFVTFEVIMEVLIVYFTASLVDNGINAGNLDVILKMGGMLALMAIISLICGTLSGDYCAKSSAGFTKNLRKDLFEKIQAFSFKNIDKFKSSGLVTRLTTDTIHIKMAFQMIIRIAVRAPLMLIFSFVMICKINTDIGMKFLIIIPVMFIGLMIIAKFAMPYFRKTFEEYDHLNNVVSENLNGIRVVKSFTQEDYEIRKFNVVSNYIYKLFKKANDILAFNGPLMQGSIYVAILFISYIGAQMITIGSLSTGELMSLFSYIMQVLGSLMMLSMVFIMIVISKESCIRVIEILDEEVDITDKKDSIKEIKDGSIKFDNVGFSYVNKKDKLCLENINLEIKSGEKIGIIGGTGSGKSTLANLIPRLYDVTTGNLYIGSVNVKDYDLYSLREAVSVVLQKNVLFGGTIESNLKWGNKDANTSDIKEVCDISCSSEFISHMESRYNSKIEQGGTNVSGGQKQRLCIARALLKKPKILILDDSTSAVDTKTDRNIWKGMEEYLPDTTKIIIAQRISSVEKCDRIIVMDNGKINGIGSHNELLKNNKIYKEVYDSQQGGGLGE